jgi:hypothetical protein
METDAALWNRIMGVNVISAFYRRLVRPSGNGKKQEYACQGFAEGVLI